jgi:hypothetical protein
VVDWTSPGQVIAALGTAAPAVDDEWLNACVDAANAAAYRKRAAAGHVDPATGTAPTADIGMGATMWAVALWHERASTDSFASFDDLSSFTPTGGTWGSIKRLLAIGRAQTDTVPAGADVVNPLLERRRRRGLARLRGVR